MNEMSENQELFRDHNSVQLVDTPLQTLKVE